MLKSDLIVCFLGGDKRQKYAAEKLSEFYRIKASGECFVGASGIKCSDNPQKAMHSSSVIVLPLPAIKCENVLSFMTIAEYAKKSHAVIIGGMFSQYMIDAMESLSVRFFDYYNDECFTIKNAYLTAEGALSLAMQTLETDIAHGDFAILGYGRIGSALGEMISANKGAVSVYARRKTSQTLAKERGLRAFDISEISVSRHDVIFNTIPERVISNESILGFDPSTVMIELASAPGGFDIEIAEQYGIKCISAQGLPGKYAPVSAGAAVADAISEIIDKELLL